MFPYVLHMENNVKTVRTERSEVYLSVPVPDLGENGLLKIKKKSDVKWSGRGRPADCIQGADEACILA